MTDSRQRRKAKQARRDARRSRQRHDSPEESPLLDELRDALDSGEPMELLGLAGLIVAATAPPQLSLSRHDDGDSMSLGELVDSFVEVGIRETTALLAVFAEILVDDDVLRDRCRREVAARDDELPPWLVDLSKTRVQRAVRMTHVLGDGDELLVEMRLADGRPLTCAAFIDHNVMSMIKDAFFMPGSLEEVLDVARRSNDDPDTTFVDMTLADTRAWLAHGLEYPWFAQDESDTWPASRALVQWLVARLPEGGARYEACELDWGQREQLLDRFFAGFRFGRDRFRLRFLGGNGFLRHRFGRRRSLFLDSLLDRHERGFLGGKRLGMVSLDVHDRRFELVDTPLQVTCQAFALYADAVGVLGLKRPPSVPELTHQCQLRTL